MTPAPAPMTADEALMSLEGHIDNSPAAEPMTETMRDWFHANWPAGGAVTGRAVYEALVTATEGFARGWDELDAQHQADYDRAAARLSAQTIVDESGNGRHLTPAPPVAFDVEAVALKISQCYCEDPELSVHHAARGVLTEMGAAAPATALVVPEASELAKALYAAGLDVTVHATGSGAEVEHFAVVVERLNRARAGTAGQTTGAQWVRRPEGQASSIKTPAECGVDGETFIAYSHPRVSYGAPTVIRAKNWGYGIETEVQSWCVPFTDIMHRRTPATAGGWTASVIPSGVKLLAFVNGEPSQDWATDKPEEVQGHEAIARYLNDIGADWLLVLPVPPVEAHP